MTFAIEIKERLPDWTQETFERYRMQQMTAILERRFQTVEEALIEIQISNRGSITGGEFAPLVHTHGLTEISDYPADVISLEANPGHVSFRDDVTLGDLSDVNLTGITNNSVIKWDQGNSEWIVDDFASAGNSLASLTDTTIGTPVDGDILSFDGGLARWVNSDVGALPYVQKAGDTMTGNLQFTDLLLLTFGDAVTDYQIYWDGAEARHDIDNGIWRLRHGGETGILSSPNAAVELAYDGTLTARTGVNTFEVWDGVGWEDVVLDTRTLDVIETANETIVDLAGPVDLSIDRAWTVGLADDAVMPGVASMRVPTGTTAQEPGAVDGMIRWDTDLDTLRFVEGITPTWRSAAWEGGAFHDGFSDYASDEHIGHSTVTVTLTGDTNEISIAGAAQDLASSLSFTVGISDDPVFPGVASATMPAGTTAQEPTPVNGMVRYDSDTGKLRGVEGGAWADIIGGGGGGALGGLSDVTITAAAQGDMFYKSAGDWVNTSVLNWDSAAQQLSIGTVGGARYWIDSVLGIQRYSTGTSVATMNLQPEGGGIQIGDVGGTSATSLNVYNTDGVAGLSWDGVDELVLRLAGADTGGALSFRDPSNIPMVYHAFNSSVGYTITLGDGSGSGMNGRPFRVEGRNVGNTATNWMFYGDPDAETRMYYAGTERISSASDGADVFGTFLDLENSAATSTWLRVWNTQGGVGFNVDTSGDATVGVLNGSGGAIANFIGLVSGADVNLLYNNAEVARTMTAANGGWEVNNTLTGGGFERVLTESDGGFHHRAILAAQATATSTTTLATLTGFSTTLAASTRYRFRVVLWVSNATGAGINPGLRLRANYTGTNGSREGMIVVHQSGSLRNADRALPDTTITDLYAGTTADEAMVVYEGMFESVTSGTFAIQFAQATAGAGATAVEEGSSMEVWTA